MGKTPHGAPCVSGRIFYTAMKNSDRVHAGEPARRVLRRPANRFHRILVVDKDSDLRMLYTEALAQPGYAVDVAEDGAAGWEALQSNPYDLLIVENDVPRLSGVELVRKLRSARMLLPVVMATERLPVHELAANPSLRLAATLAKPFAMDALLDTVKHALRATIRPRERTGPSPHWQPQPAAHALRL